MTLKSVKVEDYSSLSRTLRTIPSKSKRSPSSKMSCSKAIESPQTSPKKVNRSVGLTVTKVIYL